MLDPIIDILKETVKENPTGTLIAVIAVAAIWGIKECRE